MPLREGKSKKTISANIRELTKANKNKKKKRSRKQIIAIALEEARKSGAKIPKKQKTTKK